MKLKSIVFTRRLAMEPYGYREFQATAEVADGDDELGALNDLKSLVEASIHEDQAAAPKQKEDYKEEDASEIKDEAPVEAPQKEESAAPTKKRGRPSKAKAEASEAVTESLETLNPKKEEKAPASGRKLKAVTYDRDNAIHKKLFVGLLDDNFPNWKREMPGRGKDVSIDMVGLEFLDSEGEILESFRKDFMERMG